MPTPKPGNRLSLKKLYDLKMLVMDVDGVMTDGLQYYSAEGHIMKAFNVHDGQGLRYLANTNVRTAIISVSAAQLIVVRAEEFGVRHILINQRDKGAAMTRLIAETGINPAHIAYIGDDVPDIVAMHKVGISITVPNAHPEVMGVAQYITKTAGGHGAIRELTDLICAAQATA